MSESLQETMTIMLSRQGDGEPPEPIEIPRRVGNVRLGAVLGEGTGGVVFSGYDDALGRRVAVKLFHGRAGGLSESALSEIVSGVRAAAAVKHPNIVTVYSVERVRHMPVIVMELIEGVALRELLRRAGVLDLDTALFIARSICSGVEALHDHDVVHRDIKPANILFDPDGEAHVVDFGLACSLGGGRADVAEQIAGSPLYMAPEIFSGHISQQGDVYALGVILFELLSGAPPFSASSLLEMREAHARLDPPLHLLAQRGVPEEIVEIVGRALHKVRILRFKTAGHLLRALSAVASGRSAERLRMRLASLIAARSDAPAAPAPAASELTTFDLVARRAAAKRERS